MIRYLDIILSLLGLIILGPLLLFITFLCSIENRSPFFLQQRIGKDEILFQIIKFRTMKIGTPSVATHLVDNSATTKIGKIIRKLKIDELPQLINVLKGEMSFVGPRPNLPNQEELIKLRKDRGVYSVRPGITGLAQITGIDMSRPEELAEKDLEMINALNACSYLKFLFLTLIGSGFGDRLK